MLRNETTRNRTFNLTDKLATCQDLFQRVDHTLESNYDHVHTLETNSCIKDDKPASMI